MITSALSAINFKSVYCLNDNITNKQSIAAKNIISKLILRDFSQSEQMSYLDRYEKEGTDFVIVPSSDECSVDLYACKNVSKSNRRIVQNNLSMDKVGKYIGTYNQSKSFRLSDLESYHEMPPHLKLFSLLILAAGVIALPIVTHVRKSVSPHYMNKNYHMVDSFSNSADTIVKDTVKFMSEVK